MMKEFILGFCNDFSLRFVYKILIININFYLNINSIYSASYTNIL